MKRALWILFFSFTLCKLSAGADELTWYEGSVVLETREVLVGEIAMQVKHDLILFRTHDQVTVYRAHKIHSVQYYDRETNINRKFVSVRQSKGLLPQCQLYERVVRGAVSVLRKEKILSTGTSEKDDFAYFVQYNSRLLSLYFFRSEVYPDLMMKGGPKLNVFVSSNNLNPNNSADAIEIVMYYNQLIRQDQTLAMN